MVLIDTLYVNNGGGRVLLDYLIAELEKSNLDLFYLFDSRCKNNFTDIPANRKIFLKASIRSRYKFYYKNKEKFTKVLCFGNFAPPIKLSVGVYTYFHNVLILDIPREYTFFTKYKMMLRLKYFVHLLKNTDKIIVQSDVVKGKLSKLYHSESISVMPFFRKLSSSGHHKKQQQFLYVASFLSHKNYQRLFQAWELLASRSINPELHLTVIGNDELDTRIKELNDKGIRVINHGFLNRTDLSKLYDQSEYLVYPSLAESFGLPLLEACDHGCKIIAADLPYVHQVVNPSLTFDPLSVTSIATAIQISLCRKVPETTPKAESQMKSIVKLLH